MSRFHYSCPMRWGDLDAQGHVNNAVFLEYLQEARVEFLLTGPPIMHQLLATGVLVVSHQVEYLSPMSYDGSPVEIELWLESVGGSRFEVGYEVSHAQRLSARARTVGVPYDLTRGTLRRLLPGERAEFAAALETGEPLRTIDKVSPGAKAHRFPIRVRWSDLDSYGHVNNVKFYDYIQEARIALMGETLERPAAGDSGEVWVIARQDLEYARPLDFRLRPYEVATGVAFVGRRSITLSVELRDPATDTVYATARTVLVSPSPLTEEQRVALDRHAVS
ncbi:MAG TPA: thioesterase family protein [Microlunatus sp.]|nr:thioesterase family protein [Microlunatus sp.]